MKQNGFLQFGQGANKPGHFGLWLVGLFILLGGLATILISLSAFAGYWYLGAILDVLPNMGIGSYTSGLIGGLMGIGFTLFGWNLMGERRGAFWALYCLSLLSIFAWFYMVYINGFYYGVGVIVSFVLVIYCYLIGKDIDRAGCGRAKICRV